MYIVEHTWFQNLVFTSDMPNAPQQDNTPAEKKAMAFTIFSTQQQQNAI